MSLTNDTVRLYDCVFKAGVNVDFVDDIVDAVLADGWVYNIDDSLNHSRILMCKRLSMIVGAVLDDDAVIVAESIVDDGWFKSVSPDEEEIVLALNGIRLYNEMLVTYFKSACRQVDEFDGSNEYFFKWFQECIFSLSENIVDYLNVLKASVPDGSFVKVDAGWTDVSEFLDGYLSVTLFGFYEVFKIGDPVNDVRCLVDVLNDELRVLESKIILF